MIELATSAFVLLSMLYGTPTTSADNTAPPKAETAIEDSIIVDNSALIAPAGRSNTVEASVRAYFKDTPILAEIARCESEFKHIGRSGNIIRGRVNKGDLGVMQINKYYHAEDAEKVGLDLMTLQGNMAFAKRLYDRYGTSPWQSSSDCWQKYVTIAKK